MKYRREIDGLRAIAVLPVILFHAGFDVFSGGFVGVDVFFVISGYLITGIILSDMEVGKFSIVTFYERRARRILPSLFFVMLCCLPFAWMWLAPNHLEDFSQSLLAVSLFSSNILFWHESGYFATAAELKPLLHTWSLAVEEQYYVLFPLFLIALRKLKNRWIFNSLVLLSIVSLLAAQLGSHYFPSATFFLLPTRAWELAIGALVAIYFLHRNEQRNISNTHKYFNELSGAVGLGLILFSIFYFDETTPFPSLYALVPTLGTALIIIFTTPDTLIGRCLGTRPMVGIGLISYSAYLWHQPLFVFARHRISQDLDTGLLLLLGFLSLVLAYFSWRFIETPFRNKQAYSRRKIFTFAVIGSVFYAAIGIAGHTQQGFPNRFEFSQQLTNSFERATPDGDCFDKPQIHEVGKWYCDIGARTADTSFIIAGDSHVISLYDVFDSAAKSLNLKGMFAGASGCTPFLDVHALRNDQNIRNCYSFNKRVLHYALDNNIKHVFLAARWTYYTDGGYQGDEFSYIGVSEDTPATRENSRKAFVHGFTKTVEEYEKHGISLHIITQVPQQKIEPDAAFLKTYLLSEDEPEKVLKNVSVRFSEHKNLNAFVTQIFAQNPYPQIINFDDILCDSHICPIGTKDQSFYFDDDHLSVSGAKRLAPEIRKLLKHTKL